MNIHLPAIWGSLGVQGFDTLPYLTLKIEAFKFWRDLMGTKLSLGLDGEALQL